MTLLHQPHDKLFKLALADPVVAREFFQAHLPETLRQHIDFNSLVLEKSSFIDDAYKNTEADIVYSARIAGELGYLYLLSEQQTQVDPWLAFRLLVYTVRLMESHRRRYPTQALPLVYPLVVYSGEEPWQAPQELFPLFGDAEALARDVFLKPFPLFDIQRIPDEDLRRQTLSGLVAFALKHQRTQQFNQFLAKLMPWIQALEALDIDIHSYSAASLSRIVIRYVIDRATEGDQQRFIAAAQQHLSEQLQGDVMTIAQQWKEEGIQIGIQKGMQQGMQQGEAFILKRQLQRKFGSLSDRDLYRIDEASADQLLEWGERVLEAKSLAEVFDA